MLRLTRYNIKQGKAFAMRAVLFFCLALLALGTHSAKAESFADMNALLYQTYGWKFNTIPAVTQGMSFNCNFPNRKPTETISYSPICVGNRTDLRLIVLWRAPTVSPNFVHVNIAQAMSRNGQIAGGKVNCTAEDVRPAVISAKCAVPFNDGSVGNAAFVHMSLKYDNGDVMGFSIILQNIGSGRTPVDPVDPMS